MNDHKLKTPIYVERRRIASPSMAVSSPLPKSRDPVSDENDTVYKVPETYRYETLSENNYDFHLRLGRSIPTEQCPVLASYLLKPDEKAAALNKAGIQFLGLELLNIWMKKQGSTIWVLKHTLEKMELFDTLAHLEKARFEYVQLYIAIHKVKTNEAGEEATETVYRQTKSYPGGKPLVDIVRPIIYRTQGLQLLQMQKFLNLRLVRSTSGDPEMIWNSPARNFKGEQVDIHMCYTDTLSQRHSEPGRKLEGVTPAERNVISWINEGSLCFGYVDPDPVTSGKGAFERLAHPVQEMGHDLDQLTKGLCLKSDLSLEGQMTKERGTRAAPEVEDWNDCPGMYNSGDPATEDTLKEHLMNDGDYVIQQTQVGGQKNLTLSVRHGNQVLQYPIVTQINCQTRYLMEGGDHYVSSLLELVDFYTHNSLHPLKPTPAAASEETVTPIYLKNPVSNIN